MPGVLGNYVGVLLKFPKKPGAFWKLRLPSGWTIEEVILLCGVPLDFEGRQHTDGVVTNMLFTDLREAIAHTGTCTFIGLRFSAELWHTRGKSNRVNIHVVELSRLVLFLVLRASAEL